MSTISPSSVRVRYPEEKDITSLALLFADARKDTDVFQKRHLLLYREIRLFRSPRKFFLLIEYEKRIAGFIRMVRSACPLSRAWWISGLEIDPELKRKGLGTYLVREACYAIYHRGCTKVMLAVNEENTAARKFYSFLNFKKAAGPYVWVLSLLYRNKEILTINMKKNRDWLNTGDSGYKYMGIR